MAGNNYYGNIEGKNIATTQPYKDKGQSYTENLKTAFSSSPIHAGDIDAEERKKMFQQLVLDGEPLNADGTIPSVINGYFSNGISRDYSDNNPPDIPGLDTESLNIPSPYMPNPSSPGVGSLDADDKPAFDGKIKDASTVNAQFGSGNNSTYNPAVSSQKFSDLQLGSYLPGNSGGN